MKKNITNLIIGVGFVLMISGFFYPVYNQMKDLDRNYLNLKEKISLGLSLSGTSLLIYGLYKIKKQVLF